MHRRNSKRGLRGTVGLIAVLGVVAAVGTVGLSASVAGAKTAPSIKNYKNKLSGNTNGWCTYSQGCNGQVGSYGTIDIVKPSFSNGGGYAAQAPAPSGQGKYARVSGAPSGASVTESTSGCSAPGSENCTGPYVLYGGNGTDSVFPTSGFTTSIKIYLDTAWAEANPGQVIDSDVSLNTNTGAYLVDSMFNLCSTAGGWAVTDSQNAGGCDAGDATVATSGWYTFTEAFTPLNGVVYVTYTVTDASGGTVWNTSHAVSNPNTNAPLLVSATGGPNYYWLPDEDAVGLPVADIALVRN